MIDRKWVSSLEDWRTSHQGSIATVTGPECVGKTLTIEEFGNRYESYVRLDMSIGSDHRSILKGKPNIDEFLHRVSDIVGKDAIVPGSTLIHLDDIHCCPDAAESLERLRGVLEVDIIASSSSITSGSSGFKDVPMEWEHRIDVRPMDFKGFLKAVNVDDEVVRETGRCIAQRTVPPRDTDSLMSEMFRKYVITGGMPECVRTMATSGKLTDVLSTSRRIIDRQIQCATRNQRRDREVITMCLRSMPEQLRANGRFTYSKIENRINLSSRHYGVGLRWLASTGILNVCHNAMHPLNPPFVNVNQSMFKAYVDSGTLIGLLDDWVSSAVMNGNFKNCQCAVAENCIANLLRSDNRKLMYYSHDRHDIDFVVPNGNGFTGIAVRSGNNERRKSLSAFLERGSISDAVELGEGNGQEGLERLPMYAAGFPNDLLCC